MSIVQLSQPGVRNAVVSCWSCKGPVAAQVSTCATCGAVQPPGTADAFARLGIDRAFAIEQADLDRQYFGFQRRLHPDRFANRSARERALAQQQAAAINDAYETLKDPLRRAVLLLRLAGRAAAADGAADPELLIEAMERREALAEAASPGAVAELTEAADADVAACRDSLGEAFAEGALDRAAALTTRLQYLVRLAEEAHAKARRLAKGPF